MHGWTRDGLPDILPARTYGSTNANEDYTFPDGTVGRVAVEDAPDPYLMITPPGTRQPLTAAIDVAVGNPTLDQVQLDLGESTVAASPGEVTGYVTETVADGVTHLMVFELQAGSLTAAEVVGDVPFGGRTDLANNVSWTTYLGQDGHFYTVKGVVDGSTFESQVWQWTVEKSESTAHGPTVTAMALGTVCIDNPNGEFGHCS